MNTEISITKNTAFGLFGGIAKRPIDLNFPGKKHVLELVDATSGAARFHWNKLVHRAGTHNIGQTLPFMTNIDTLHYFVGRDEKGILRGGNLPWLYLRDLTPYGFASRAEKFKSVCRALAQLPGNVAFSFASSPDLRDADIVRDAFRTAGFSHTARKTYTYKGVNDGTDPISKVKSDARTKVNSARRDLEFVEMSLEEFFAYYRENLDAEGKNSHFHLNIDLELISRAMNEGQIEIMAVRKKSSEDQPGPHPIDAAVVCSCGEDGYYKLMRISYRHHASGPIPPHKHALKMLVVEAMKRSAARDMVLDVDGATPGGETLYSRFGVFETVIRDEFKRKTAQTLIRKFM